MEERFVTVKLLGEPGRKFGREYRFLVRNPRDVISALSRQVDGFKEYLCMAHENNVGFKLVTKEPEGIDYEHVTMGCDRLIIAPMIAGSGGATGKILLGVALVGLSFVSFGAGTVAAGMGAAFAGGSRWHRQHGDVRHWFKYDRLRYWSNADATSEDTRRR